MALPIDLKNDKAVGITFPLRRGQGGYFEQSYITVEQVKTNIINLLLTMKGERVMQPRLGTNIYEQLFEQIQQGLVTEEINSSIERAIEQWLPYVNIVNLDTVIDENNPNRINIRIDFELRFDPDNIESVDILISV